MVDPDRTLETATDTALPAVETTTQHPALVVAWSRVEPERVGEVALVHGGEVFGRGDDGGRGGGLVFARQRPGSTSSTGPLRSRWISRAQWRLTIDDGQLHIENLGRKDLRVNRRVRNDATVEVGDVVGVDGEVAFVVTRRPGTLPRLLHLRGALHPFGGPDADGIVGESPASWALRDRIAFAAARDAHVLVQGPSGVGKELVGRALHRASSRAGGPLVRRSAATLPESLIEAELFGHARDYPTAGMPARRGLIGEADTGILLLDEVGELPLGLQARLLRVLDSGEYTRLGEGVSRGASLRLVALTLRRDEDLRDDLLARFKVRVQVPSLSERIADVPLLARHLLRTMTRTDPAVVERFLDEHGEPRPSQELLTHLCLHAWPTNVRQLERVILECLAASRTDRITWAIPEPIQATPTSRAAADPELLDPGIIQACLDRHGGRQEPVWKELGLSSRYVLRRLIQRHGLRTRRSRG